MCKPWRKLNVSKADLHLKLTLSGGQSFRWKNNENGDWIGVFRNLIWILRQSDNHLFYQCYGKSNEIKKKNKQESIVIDTDNVLMSYLRLNIDLNHYYSVWSESDPNFLKAAPKFNGIRILNQEVIENIFSFICSSNNNIKRISSMVNKLCELYGDPIAEIENQKYHSFPVVESLAQSFVETELRKAGFGYRAKFIYQSACAITKFGGRVWVENLKLLPYSEAKKELMKLPGIGAKVADCICLMSLGHMEAVPVDTHIFQVASNIYLPHLKKYKTLNNKIYNEIGDFFRLLHGNYAGWANTVLFCSDLKIFNTVKKKPEGEK